MITLVSGNKKDDPNTFTLTLDEATVFAKDLMRAVEETEDHQMTDEVILVSEARSKQKYLKFFVTLNPKQNK